MLSIATESVAAKTGDSVGGLLNATLEFWSGVVMMVTLATLTVALVSSGGRATWFTGVLVISVYLTFAVTLYLLPPRIP